MKQKMTLVIGSLRVGGAERVCVTLANELAELGYNVDLVVLGLRDATMQADLTSKVNLVDLRVDHARNSFFHLARYLKHSLPKTVLSFNGEISAILGVIRIIYSIKFKLVSRAINFMSLASSSKKGLWYGVITKFMVRKLYSLSDAFIAQSKAMAEDLEKYLGLDKQKITVINNPVSKIIETDDAKCNLKNQHNDDYLLCVGKLEKQKAFHYAIEAFAITAKQNPLLKLKIVGKGSLESELKEYAIKYGVADRVEFEGYQADLINYYLHARATVLTSLYEGFPNVLTESITLGTPVVSFDCPSGPGEIIEDGVNGYLVRYKDLEHLLECIQKVLEKQWDTLKVKKSANKFKSDVIVQDYIKVLTAELDDND